MNKKILASSIIIIVIFVSGVFYFLYKQQGKEQIAISVKTTEFTDKEIVNFAKSENITPDYFTVDKDEKFLGEYGSVLYADEKINDKNIFYCTNNIENTEQYINKFIKNESGGGLKGAEYDVAVIKTSENYRFFEFKISKNEKRGSREHNYQYRIFKCSYIYDLLYGVYGNPFLNHDEIDNVYIGKLNLKPLNMDIVKEFSELMWSEGGFKYGQKVLNSFTERQNGSFNHIIYEIETACLENSDCCSTILYKSNYIVNESSGKINFSRKQIKTVEHGSTSCYNLK